MLYIATIVQVLDLNGYILIARGFGNGNVLNRFDLERADTIRGDTATLLVEVANSLASEGRRDLDGVVSELQRGISYRHG